MAGQTLQPPLDRSPALEMSPEEVLHRIDAAGLSEMQHPPLSGDADIHVHRKQIEGIDYMLLIAKFTWGDDEEVLEQMRERRVVTDAIGEVKKRLGRTACDPEQELYKFATLVDMARERSFDPLAVIEYFQGVIGDSLLSQMEIIGELD